MSNFKNLKPSFGMLHIIAMLTESVQVTRLNSAAMMENPPARPDFQS